MKKIIALQGLAKHGKSPTLRLVFEKMTPNNGYSIVRQSGRVDIYAIIVKNRKKIGLSTAGDIRRWIRRWLDDFKNEKCEIIVIACHPDGPTVEEIENMRDDRYDIEYIPKTYGRTIEEKSDTNKGDANRIFDRVEQLVI